MPFSNVNVLTIVQTCREDMSRLIAKICFHSPPLRN